MISILFFATAFVPQLDAEDTSNIRSANTELGQVTDVLKTSFADPLTCAALSDCGGAGGCPGPGKVKNGCLLDCEGGEWHGCTHGFK